MMGIGHAPIKWKICRGTNFKSKKRRQRNSTNQTSGIKQYGLRQNMVRQAFVQQLAKHIIRTWAEVSTKAVGEQKCHPAGNITCQGTWGAYNWLTKTNQSKNMKIIILPATFLAPIIVSGICRTRPLQIRLQCLLLSLRSATPSLQESSRHWPKRIDSINAWWYTFRLEWVVYF